jgi:hypothetical protein
LELHQQDAFAFKDTSSIGAELVIAQYSNVLETEEIFIRPWRSEYHIRKKFPGITIGIIDAGEDRHYCTPPPTRGCT